MLNAVGKQCLGIEEGLKRNGLTFKTVHGAPRTRGSKNYGNYLITLLFTINTSKDIILICTAIIFFRPKYVIIIPEPLAVPVFIVSRLLEIKYYVYCAGTFTSRLLRSEKKYERLSLKKADKVYPMSAYLKQMIRQGFKGRYRVIGSGYDDTMASRTPKIRKVKGQFCFVGNLKIEKDLIFYVMQ